MLVLVPTAVNSSMTHERPRRIINPIRDISNFHACLDVIRCFFKPPACFISCCLSLCLIIAYPIQTATQALAMMTRNIGPRNAPKNTAVSPMKQLERQIKNRIVKKRFFLQVSSHVILCDVVIWISSNRDDNRDQRNSCMYVIGSN